MKKFIRAILNKYEKLDYIQTCIRNIKNDEFIKNVLKKQKDPFVITYESLGVLNKDKTICIYENKDSKAGFFWAYRKVLNFLYFADRFNFIPVVSFDKDFLYAEKEIVNGTNNPFEYYFKQTSDVGIDEAFSSYNIVKYQWYYNKLAEDLKEKNGGECGYIISGKYFEAMSIIVKKYIRLNPIINDFIYSGINNLINGSKTLGVHVRGTDYKVGFNRHPVYVEPKDYIAIITQKLQKYNFEKIFLATDDLSAIEIFKDAFGDIVVYYKDVVRTADIKSVAYSSSTREHHHYMLGLEVLRDMYTLANCEGMIAGLSQVSICAQITKLSMDQRYDYLHIIDKGLNKSDKIRYIEKYVKKVK